MFGMGPWEIVLILVVVFAGVWCKTHSRNCPVSRQGHYRI